MAIRFQRDVFPSIDVVRVLQDGLMTHTQQSRMDFRVLKFVITGITTAVNGRTTSRSETVVVISCTSW